MNPLVSPIWYIIWPIVDSEILVGWRRSSKPWRYLWEKDSMCLSFFWECFFKPELGLPWKRTKCALSPLLNFVQGSKSSPTPDYHVPHGYSTAQPGTQNIFDGHGTEMGEYENSHSIQPQAPNAMLSASNSAEPNLRSQLAEALIQI